LVAVRICARGRVTVTATVVVTGTCLGKSKADQYQ
jgi:hypothetical protein